MPDIHAFGHTHIPIDQTIGGVRYVQWALGTPREQTGQTRVVFGLMRLYDGTAGGETPQHWTHWTAHYQTYERDLERTEPAPYLTSYIAKRRGGGAGGKSGGKDG